MALKKLRKNEETKQNKKATLVSLLKQTAPSRVLATNPLTKLAGEDKEEWEQVKTALKAGQLAHLSLNVVRKMVCERFKIHVPQSTFRDLLIKEHVITT